MIVYVVIAYQNEGYPGHNIKKVTSVLDEAEELRDSLKFYGWENVEVYDYEV